MANATELIVGSENAMVYQLTKYDNPCTAEYGSPCWTRFGLSPTALLHTEVCQESGKPIRVLDVQAGSKSGNQRSWPALPPCTIKLLVSPASSSYLKGLLLSYLMSERKTGESVENFATIFCIGLVTLYLLLFILLLWFPSSRRENSTLRAKTRKWRAWRLPFRTNAKQ
jgi:hypothetical protein